MPRPNPLNPEHIKDLAQALLSLENEEQCIAFLRDLCTMQELIQLSSRLQVAKLLTAGETYETIQKQLPVSSTTITRISTALHFGSGGYQTVLRRQAEERTDPEKS